MGQVLVDDLDNTVHTDETPVLSWQFGFGPANNFTKYKIDLTEANYAKIEEALKPFLAKAEKVSTASPRAASGSGSTATTAASKRDYNLADLREWAVKNKIEGVRERGRIAGSIVEQYKEAVASGKWKPVV